MEERTGLPTVFITPLFQFFTILLLFIALFYRQQSLVFLALLILIMINGAKLWCRLSLGRIKCRLMAHRTRIFPDEIVRLKIEIENAKLLPVRLYFKMPLPGMLLSGISQAFEEACGLLWYQKVVWDLELTAGHRGVHLLGPPCLAAGDLFGFFQRSRDEYFGHEVIIYPRLVPLHAFPFPLRDFFGSPKAKKQVEDPVYPIATREYQHGRPARYIHWKASARHGRLQEKIFEPTSQKKVLFLVDVEAFAREKATKSFECTLEAVASLGAMLEAGGSPIGLATNGTFTRGTIDILPAGKGQQQLSNLLEMLARLKMEPGASMKDMLLKANLSAGMTCVYFSYQMHATALLIQEILSEYSIPLVFIVDKPSELVGLSGSRIYRLQDIRSRERCAP